VKEAVVKALGTGLATPPQKLQVVGGSGEAEERWGRWGRVGEGEGMVGRPELVSMRELSMLDAAVAERYAEGWASRQSSCLVGRTGNQGAQRRDTVDEEEKMDICLPCRSVENDETNEWWKHWVGASWDVDSNHVAAIVHEPVCQHNVESVDETWWSGVIKELTSKFGSDSNQNMENTTGHSSIVITTSLYRLLETLSECKRTKQNVDQT
jgi:hypothetical protein